MAVVVVVVVLMLVALVAAHSAGHGQARSLGQHWLSFWQLISRQHLPPLRLFLLLLSAAKAG